MLSAGDINMVLLSEQLLIAPLALLIGHHCGSRRGPAYRTGHGPSFVCVPGFFSRGHGPRSGCHPLTSIPQAPACTATQLHPPPTPLERHVFSQHSRTSLIDVLGRCASLSLFQCKLRGTLPSPHPLVGFKPPPSNLGNQSV